MLEIMSDMIVDRQTDDARWCSGSTGDFGSSDPGSNPGRAAWSYRQVST